MTLKSPKILLAYIVAWMFFFPISFTFLPAGINSKMLVAVLGIVIYVFKLRRGGADLTARPQLVVMALWAVMFSLECYFSVTYNNTQDRDYITYIVSMCVWLGAAYAAYSVIDQAHGGAGMAMMCKYVVALCVGQAFVSLMMKLSPGFFDFLSHYFFVQESKTAWESRLCGLGASADTGGIRFSLGLISLGFLMGEDGNSKARSFVYNICFFIIFIIGNMMSRTTSIGAIIALVYILFRRIWPSDGEGWNINFRGLLVFLVSAVVVGGAVYVAYYVSPVIRELIQFGFEGFFNYAESGQFRTHSSDNLTDMWSVWPDNPKTWFIGDGLFADPFDSTKFYMRTDVGYARLIFYCGLVGLVTFSSFLIYTAHSCIKRNKRAATFFVFILIFQAAVWVKVSTDLFFILAFFFFARPEEEMLLSDTDEDII